MDTQSVHATSRLNTGLTDFFYFQVGAQHPHGLFIGFSCLPLPLGPTYTPTRSDTHADPTCRPQLLLCIQCGLEASFGRLP